MKSDQSPETEMLKVALISREITTKELRIILKYNMDYGICNNPFLLSLERHEEPALSTTRKPRRQTEEVAISQEPLETAASEIKVPKPVHDADEPENALKNIWPLAPSFKKEAVVSSSSSPHSVLFLAD